VFGTGVLGGGLGLVLLLLWARVRSRAHTLNQAAAGTVLGFVAPYLELTLLAPWLGL
jgi:cell division protein FtsX